MGNFFHLWPVLLFLAFMLGVSFWVQRASRGDRQQNFAKDYFIGGRSLGGFVLDYRCDLQLSQHLCRWSRYGLGHRLWLALYGDRTSRSHLPRFRYFRQKDRYGFTQN